MESQLLNLLIGQNTPMMANLMGMAKGAGLIDLAMQGYGAYQNGKIPEFMQYQYDNNIAFRKFYDKNREKTLEEILRENGIHLE